jgi:hypothetical protein
MERGDAFIRPSHVRSNVTLRIYAPTRLRLGPRRRSLSPSLRRPRVARRGPGARSTTWPGVPVTTRRMLDRSKTRQIGDPGLAPILFGGLPKALAAISECV